MDTKTFDVNGVKRSLLTEQESSSARSGVNAGYGSHPRAVPSCCGCQRLGPFSATEDCDHCTRTFPVTQELSLERLRDGLEEAEHPYEGAYQSYQWFEQDTPVYRSVKIDQSMHDYAPTFETTTAPTKTVPHRPYTNRSVNTLIWKFSQYPVSLKHGFSSCSLSYLHARIEEALKDLKIDYKFDGAALLYICEKTEYCVCNSFTVIVSQLQKSCQEELGYDYVVELCHLGGDTCPTVWNRLTNSFWEAVKDVVICPTTKQSDDGDLTQKMITDREAKRTVGNEVLTNFIDILYSSEVSEATVRLAEVFAELTSPCKAEYNEKWMQQKDVDKLIALTERGDRNLSRCVCTVIFNFAQAGLLQFISEQAVENLLKALVRLLNVVDSSDVFLLEMQREAMRALLAITEVHKPKGFLRAMAASVVKRCSTSSDDRLSGYAGQALNLYVL